MAVVSGGGRAREGLRGAARAAGRAWAMGPRNALRRAALELVDRTGADELSLMLRTEDVMSSQAVARDVPAPRAAPASGLRIAWAMIPPAPGSGGHTTAFRMVEALEAAGHTCVLALYDPVADDVAPRERVVRDAWPRVRAAVVDLRGGLRGVDVVVATSWQTAHAVARYVAGPVHRLYFVQDFEPYFYPRGSEHELASDTYRFGFTTLALGRTVAQELRENVGVEPVLVPFGCDQDVYGLLDPAREREGVVFYARPGPARRGYLLGALALEELHRMRPATTIHTYGGTPRGLRVPHERHGSLTAGALNALYNETVAGIALAFTNMSLVPEEMLAAGAIPVVNDAPRVRADLDNPFVRWAAPTPRGIAEELAAALDRDGRDEVARAAATSVHRAGWDESTAVFVRAVLDVVAGRRAVRPT